MTHCEDWGYSRKKLLGLPANEGYVKFIAFYLTDSERLGLVTQILN